MEPNHNTYQPSAELPQPQDHSELPGMPTRAESRPAAPEQAVNPSASAQAGQQALQPVSPQSAAPAQNLTAPAAPLPASNGTNALIADDVDLIEKEWVVKAKAIVAQTKNDPHMQNQAMNQVKADYLKKRYNKDLKVSNEN